MMKASAGSLRSPKNRGLDAPTSVWNCCEGNGKSLEMLLRANVLEAAVADDVVGYTENSLAGWALAKELESDADIR